MTSPFVLDGSVGLGHETILAGIPLQQLALHAGPRFENPLLGTMSTTRGSNVVAGTGTKFTRLAVGTAIKIGETAARVAAGDAGFATNDDSVLYLDRTATLTESNVMGFIDFPLASIDTGLGNSAFTVHSSGTRTYACSVAPINATNMHSLMVSDLLSGMIRIFTAGVAFDLQLPLGSSVAAALAPMTIQHAFDVVVINTSGHTATITANTGMVLSSGTTTIADLTTTVMRFVYVAANLFNVYL
jgi:hypothetical protein